MKEENDEFFDAPAPQDDSGSGASKKSAKKSWIKRVVAVVLAAVVLAVGFTVGWFGHYYSLDGQIRDFMWAKSVADDHYYKEIDEDALYERMFSGLDLDPYSTYYSAEEYAAIERERQGDNIGIGVSLTEAAAEGGVLPRIALVVENSPAQRAGVAKGMFVYGFGATEQDLATGGVSDVIDFLSGTREDFYWRVGYSAESATTVKLRRAEYHAVYCSYRDSETSFHFRGDNPVLTETNLPLTALDAETAYIRIDEFNGNAASEFLQCLTEMKKRNRRNLVLDLRTNGGGYLTILQSIAAHLLRDGKGLTPVICTSKYRSGRQDVYRAMGNDFDQYFQSDSVITVLADEGTASASEALIGALVDYGTVGYENIWLRKNEAGVAKTYGKGIMQTSYVSASGAAMKLTVAEIFWPNGKSIHGKGVTEADGAKSFAAPLVWGESDPMLDAAIADVCR